MTGRPVDAALGVIAFCNVPEEEVWAGMSEGVASIEREFLQHGTEDDRLCLHYVLHGRTGDLAHRRWPNGFMDEGRPIGLALADFCDNPNALLAGLRPHHVAARCVFTLGCLPQHQQPAPQAGEARLQGVPTASLSLPCDPLLHRRRPEAAARCVGRSPRRQ